MRDAMSSPGKVKLPWVVALNAIEGRIWIMEAACVKLACVMSMPIRPTLTTIWASGTARNAYPQEGV